ncbi:MAG: ATP-binding cassette, subfamily bacterial [Pseudonocardiales bacterium]|nr:ATP-binding cassette, subfamily bacterial [Pseudonocardiales bacterium]
MPLPLVLDVARPRARGELRPLAASAALGIVGVLLELARPWPLALAIDYAIGGRSLVGMSPGVLLVAAGAAVVTLTAISGLVDMAAVVSAERAAERVGARLRQDLFDRSISLSLRWHDRTPSGELISRLTTDVGRLLDALVAICSTFLPDAVRLGLVLGVLLVINPMLALVGLAVVPVLLVFAIRQRRLVRTVQRDARAESGRFAGAAVDLVRNVRAVQAFGRSSRSSDLFRERNRALLDVSLRAVTTEARWAPVADILLAVGSGLVLVIGGRQVLAGQLSTGELLVVMTYISALYSPVRGLSRLSGVLAKSSASAGRVREVLHCVERVSDRPGAQPAPPISNEVRFDAVRFGYHPDQPVLDEFDLTLSAGETVCLLGPSGAGKSTILHLLLRLYDVESGSVQLDGVDVRDIDQHSLRQRIAFVPQDPWLFDATIAENIAFGSPSATRHGVLRAGRNSLVDEFADRLPYGYETRVGEGAARLSGGQRRRIALARAAVSDAPLVLLDEPTASLDHESSAAVISAIRGATAGRTVLLVTHDRDLAELADRVVVLDRHGASRLRLVEPLISAEGR